jgi:hypothetical protein
MSRVAVAGSGNRTRPEPLYSYLKKDFFLFNFSKKKNKKQNHLPTDTTMFFSCLHGQVAQDVAAATRQKGSLIKNYNADGQKRTFEAFFSAEVPHKFI